MIKPLFLGVAVFHFVQQGAKRETMSNWYVYFISFRKDSL